MFRAIVKNLVGDEINCHIDMENLDELNEFLRLSGEVNQVWGLPNRWVDAILCSETEKAVALSQREISIGFGEFKTQYQFPAEYSVSISDVSIEYKQKDLKTFSEQKIKDTDTQVEVLLGGISDRRATATALYNLGVVVNPLGNFTQEQIDAAKIQVGNYFSIMAQIEQFFSQRDSDIEAYKVSLGL
jgi:predicted PP-loop superfamily ATPase